MRNSCEHACTLPAKRRCEIPPAFAGEAAALELLLTGCLAWAPVRGGTKPLVNKGRAWNSFCLCWQGFGLANGSRFGRSHCLPTQSQFRVCPCTWIQFWDQICWNLPASLLSITYLICEGTLKNTLSHLTLNGLKIRTGSEWDLIPELIPKRFIPSRPSLELNSWCGRVCLSNKN